MCHEVARTEDIETMEFQYVAATRNANGVSARVCDQRRASSCPCQTVDFERRAKVAAARRARSAADLDDSANARVPAGAMPHDPGVGSRDDRVLEGAARQIVGVDHHVDPVRSPGESGGMVIVDAPHQGVIADRIRTAGGRTQTVVVVERLVGVTEKLVAVVCVLVDARDLEIRFAIPANASLPDMAERFESSASRAGERVGGGFAMQGGPPGGTALFHAFMAVPPPLD